MKAGFEYMKDGFDVFKGGFNNIKDGLSKENNSFSAKGTISSVTKLALVEYTVVSGFV
jgi:hypothetical protein